MRILFVLGLGLATAIAASGPADASKRCDKSKTSAECRDTNAGTARAAKTTQHTIKSPRDTASGQATGKRMHKPMR